MFFKHIFDFIKKCFTRKDVLTLQVKMSCARQDLSKVLLECHQLHCDLTDNAPIKNCVCSGCIIKNNVEKTISRYLEWSHYTNMHCDQCVIKNDIQIY